MSGTFRGIANIVVKKKEKRKTCLLSHIVHLPHCNPITPEGILDLMTQLQKHKIKKRKCVGLQWRTLTNTTINKE